MHALESQTEPFDMKLEQPDRQSANDSQMSFPNLLPAPNFLPDSSSLNRIDVLQDEVLHLRAQVSLLESQLAACKDITAADETAGDAFVPVVIAEDVPRVPVLASHGVPVVPKMAERVKLKRTNEEDYITGPEITNTGVSGRHFYNISPELYSLTIVSPLRQVCTTEIAEHLVSDLYQNVASPGDASQLQLEVKQMQRRIEYLKVQNTILSLTIAESKQHCDHLYLLCGKYESNAIALQQALNYSDRAIESYDVMLALFESRLDIVQNNPGAVKNKEDAENVAKHLLNHLDRETNVQSISLGPWQDSILLYSEK